MLIVETIAKIRRYYFVEGRGIKKISKDLNISRNTVRDIIRSGKTKNEYSRKKQPYPQLGPYLGVPDEELEKWKKRDPVKIAENKLLKKGLSKEEIKKIQDGALAEIEEAEKFTLESKYPEFSDSMQL